jgi:hypothetical protein
MNEAQRLWWAQAKSDHGIFVLLRRQSAVECHLLHYLQMATEKIAKAYLWRSRVPPARSHVGYRRFTLALLDRNSRDMQRIAKVFGFARPRDLDSWVRQVSPLAHELQNLAPAEANDGPNPEYPWPHDSPDDCPAEYTFGLWEQLQNAPRGRELLKFIRNAVERFEQYA